MTFVDFLNVMWGSVCLVAGVVCYRAVVDGGEREKQRRNEERNGGED